jgi:putative thioredoxin
MSDTPFIVETTAATFAADVYERSKSVPVVVDFWAAWCQPCRRLGPLLEAAANEAGGQFALVKADVDQLPEHAAAFRVEGIPAVYAVRNGEIVDSFVGLLTEPQLREWLQRIVPSQAELLAAEAQALEATDIAAATASYRAAIELDPNQAGAQIGLARVLAAAGQSDEARALIGKLEERGFLEPAAHQVKASLALASHAASPTAIEELRTRAAGNPADTVAQLDLTQALLAAGQYEEGLPLAVEIVRSGNREHREQARLALLDTFTLLGDQAELTQRFRRELAMALY